jgi:hypothetical protein
LPNTFIAETFEVLRMVRMKIIVFTGVTPYSLENRFLPNSVPSGDCGASVTVSGMRIGRRN